MNGTLLELRDIAVSQDLKERLMMAVAKVAVEVYSDSEETEQHKKYAVQVAKNPRSIAASMAPVIVTIASSDSDAHLTAATKTVFNVYASEVEVSS